MPLEVKIKALEFSYGLTMTWFDIYNQFIKNIEKVTQLQRDYVTNLEPKLSKYPSPAEEYSRFGIFW
jgi:hypothetical protein